MENAILPVELPKDNGTHQNTIEWWYFNGHLKDDGGNEYGFMDCLFKVDCEKVNILHLLNHEHRNKCQKGEYIFFSHSVVSDITKKKNYKEVQNISMLSHDSLTKEKFFVEYSDSVSGKRNTNKIEEFDKNSFKLKTKNLDLILNSKKSPLLEGGHGYVGTPESGSYYYSLTDLETNGILSIDGKEIKVSGKAWMDHQWANAVYKKDKWTWFSFQLENGMELMCVEYDTTKGTDILINTIDARGVQAQYKNAIFARGADVWKSGKTKAEYPMSWEINIPEAKISLSASSSMDDQEMIFGQINYWEGPMNVTAKIDGAEVKGKGYMELVGYPSDYNFLLLEGEKIKNNILNKLKNIFKSKN